MSKRPRRPRRPPVKIVPSRRYAAIELLKKDHAASDVADMLGVTYEAVRKWRAAYEKGGIEALAPKETKRGPAPLLTAAQAKRLARAAQRRGATSLPEVVAIAREQGIELERRSIRRGLAAAGLWPLPAEGGGSKAA